MSQEIFLVFKGWDGPESSPNLDSAFDSFDKAKAWTDELEKADIAKHMTNYPEGSICWHDHPNGSYHRYRRSFVRYEKSGDEYTDEVIYIEGVYLNETRSNRT